MSARSLTLTFLALALAAVLLAPLGVASALEAAPPPETAGIHAQEGGSEGGVDVVASSLWAIVGIAIGGVVVGVLYLFKRRIGGFPANPAWVAPITIMPSKDFPDEGTFGDVPADSHGHH